MKPMTFREHGTLLVIFSLLALVWLYNPLMHVQTDMVSDPDPTVTTDYYHFHWNYWWIRHALTTGTNAYETNYLFAPATSSMALHTMAATWYPIWALLDPAFSTIAAMLGVFFVLLVLNGYVMTVFLREQGASISLAIAGGVLLQGSPLMIDAVRWTMVSLMGWFWLPLVILVWIRIANARNGQAFWSALLGITLWAMILTDLQYVVFLAVAFLPVVGWTLLRAFKRESWRAAARLSAYGVGAVVMAMLALWGSGTLGAVLSFDRSTLAATPADRAPSIAFPDGFVQRLARGMSLGALPIPLLFLSIVLWLRERAKTQKIDVIIPGWVWLVTCIAPLLLSAGDRVSWLGLDVAMPYGWLHELLGGTFRYPERFGTVFLIAMLAFGLPRLTFVMEEWRRSRRRWGQSLAYGTALLIVGAAIWDVQIFGSVPIRPQPQRYGFYEAMGRETYDYVVLEVPTAGASGEGIVGRSDWAATQFYGVTHGKRMVNGHLSRVDPWRYLYMETFDAMLAWLGQRRYLEEGTVRAQLEERIYSFPIGYIVIHSQWLPANGPTLQEIVGFLNAQSDLVCPLWVEGDAIVYRTAWHPDGCPERTPQETEPGIYLIDIGAAEDQQFIGWGWHWREDVGATVWRWTGDYPRLGGEVIPEGGFLHSDLYVELPTGDYRLRFAAQAFAEPRVIDILVNDERIGRVEIMPDQLQDISLDIPADVIRDAGVIRVRFAYNRILTPLEAGAGSDTRRLAIAVDWVRFERR